MLMLREQLLKKMLMNSYEDDYETPMHVFKKILVEYKKFHWMGREGPNRIEAVLRSMPSLRPVPTIALGEFAVRKVFELDFVGRVERSL